MKSLDEIRNMNIDELNAEILVLRRKQFELRLDKVNKTLKNTNVIAQTKKSIAKIKTIITEKVGNGDGK